MAKIKSATLDIPQPFIQNKAVPKVTCTIEFTQSEIIAMKKVPPQRFELTCELWDRSLRSGRKSRRRNFRQGDTPKENCR